MPSLVCENDDNELAQMYIVYKEENAALPYHYSHSKCLYSAE